MGQDDPVLRRPERIPFHSQRAAADTRRLAVPKELTLHRIWKMHLLDVQNDLHKDEGI